MMPDLPPVRWTIEEQAILRRLAYLFAPGPRISGGSCPREDRAAFAAARPGASQSKTYGLPARSSWRISSIGSPRCWPA